MKNIYKVDSIQQADKEEISRGTSAIVLMERAAEGIFGAFQWFGKILVFVGSGNNGGDGYALACILKERGYYVRLCIVEPCKTEAANYYFEKCKNLDIAMSSFSEDLIDSHDILVDCLFGVGFRGSLHGEYRSIVESINRSAKYVISVDANSGLNLRNGMTDLAVKSNLTISISELKPGYFLNHGKDYISNIANVDIGLKTSGLTIKLLEDDDVSSLLSRRSNMCNKGDFGYVGIMGGCESYPGAVKLANLGQTALYSGAGVSKVIVPDVLKEVLYPHVLESTVYPVPSSNGHMEFEPFYIDSSLKHLKSLSIGMGWGTSPNNEKILDYILREKDLKVVVDADGLNALSKMDLEILNNTSCKVVLTPHLKEFSRLSGLSIEEICEDPVAAVKSFVEKYNVVLLLKGPTTIVADKKDIYFINRGCPGMATAGSGDVLSGVLAGVLGYLDCNLTLATAVGAYINGLAGEMAQKEFGDIGMVSSDTARCISIAIHSLQK